MQVPITINAASPLDYSQVVRLLQEQKLPVSDIPDVLPHFFLAKKENYVVGVIGLEIYESYGLLRSMATDPLYRNQAIASELVKNLLQYSAELGLKAIYLLTETAEAYFEKKGFEKIGRESCPDPVKKSSEFSHVCPTSAVLMKKEIQ